MRALRVFPEQLLADPSQYVVLTGSSAVSELITGGQLWGGVLVWSLWAGYLAEPSGQRLLAQRPHVMCRWCSTTLPATPRFETSSVWSLPSGLSGSCPSTPRVLRSTNATSRQ